MNRRTLFKSAGAAAALSALPAAALAAVTPPTLRAVTFTQEAFRHEHASLAVDWIKQVQADGHVIGQETWPIDVRVDLKDPRFEGELGQAWDSHNGYKAGLTGPRVKVFDGDVLVIEAEMYHYTGESLADDVPPVVMFTRHIKDVKALKAALPGQVRYDNSRLMAALEARAKARPPA
ncbi:hypothetical protein PAPPERLAPAPP_03670 [Brevundimonas phage vB_BpoS-Papperlapapp]|uniref:Uncharacterized protein n=1 Tax=Brevundimonas phage vB_BpoS-Domovoi TaxID=2948598 RepID=A0A9E7MS58_9CAUD|nr:hypothetical protein DOMOVOI_02620 [Brevundimonas phage vB_BpoS-Domovoi]USN16108.1 hypothetical protein PAPPERLAPAPP_03670 [Brevundimonas phage vB_BpoS-Papperlapapp]